MPSGFATLDTGFPNIKKIDDPKQQIKAVEDYLVQLLENLRYMLGNIGPENLNQTEVVGWIGETITDPINARITDDEGDIAQLALTASGLSITVGTLAAQTTVYVNSQGMIIENGTGQQVKIGNGAVKADFFYGNAYYNSAGTAYLMMDTWGGNLAAMKLYDVASQSNFFTIWKDSTHVGFGTVPSGGIGQQIADYDTATTTLTFMCNVAGISSVATFG